MRIKKINLDLTTDEFSTVHEAMTGHIKQMIKEDTWSKSYERFYRDYEEEVALLQSLDNIENYLSIQPSEMNNISETRDFNTAYEYCEFLWENKENIV